MSWQQQIVTTLEQNDVTFVTYLPDTPLSPVIETIEDDEAFTAVPVTREEEAIGVLSGAWLGGQRGALVCQSSGVATAINGFASLSKPAQIPFIGFVTRRGSVGEFNRAQIPFGYEMPEILDSIGVRNTSVSSPESLEQQADMAIKSAFATDDPFVVILESTLTGAKDEF